ncbi:MAG: DUF6624 domain-containing protein, partial [Chloroflexota bacterium]
FDIVTSAYATARMRAYFDEFGWPGPELVGPAGADAAWLVAQHAVLDPPLQRRCLTLLEAAVRVGEGSVTQFAYLTDRIRVLAGRPQWYGTQHDWDESGSMSPLPIQDAGRVDERRASAGLPTLAQVTAQLRKRVSDEGGHPPDDLKGYRDAQTEWAKTLGWQ